MFNSIKALLNAVDLVAVFERTVGAPVSSGGAARAGWLMYHCPCHADQHPSLAITPDRRHWVCFGRCNTSGDALDWLQLRSGLDLKQARAELETLASGICVAAVSKMPVKCISLPVGEGASIQVGEPPPQRWQLSARQTVHACEAALWSNRGERARAWLNRRGLDDTALRAWQIGFNPARRTVSGLFVPRGIVIPCLERGQVWSLKVRRAWPSPAPKTGRGASNGPRGLNTPSKGGPSRGQGCIGPLTGEPKYVHVAGSQPALFGAHTLVGPHPPVVVVTEGEFDAMLVHRLAGDLVGVVTLGSASTRLAETWLTELLPMAHVLVAYDADAAGAKGAAFWQALSQRVRRAILPAEPPVKDLTDFWLAGGDVRQWLRFEIRRHFGILAEPSPNSLPTPALDFSKINPAAVSRAVSPEGVPHEHDGHV